MKGQRSQLFSSICGPNKDQKWVTSVVASRPKVADAYIVRNSLLTMPVEEAIAFQLKNSHGNAIEYIFPIIQKDFERYTSDGYMHDVFANFEETVDFYPPAQLRLLSSQGFQVMSLKLVIKKFPIRIKLQRMRNFLGIFST